MNEKSPTWVKALKAKYKLGKNPKNWKNSRCTSHIWKISFHCKDTLYKASKWIVGNGTDIDL